jgi:hypothetical protein
MAEAGIRPSYADVHPGHPELARITGSRTPSGRPIATTTPIARVPAAYGLRSNERTSRRGGVWTGAQRSVDVAQSAGRVSESDLSAARKDDASRAPWGRRRRRS